MARPDVGETDACGWSSDNAGSDVTNIATTKRTMAIARTLRTTNSLLATVIVEPASEATRQHARRSDFPASNKHYKHQQHDLIILIQTWPYCKIATCRVTNEGTIPEELPRPRLRVVGRLASSIARGASLAWRRGKSGFGLPGTTRQRNSVSSLSTTGLSSGIGAAKQTISRNCFRILRSTSL